MGIADINTLYPEPNREEDLVAASEHTQDHHDDEDVKAALEKTDTADGPGFEDPSELPESDFVSFAEDDVEDVEEIDQ